MSADGAQGALVLDERDDVAVLLRSVQSGERLLAGGAGQALELRVASGLPLGHQIALRRLPAGTAVGKYGDHRPSDGDRRGARSLARAQPREPARRKSRGEP